MRAVFLLLAILVGSCGEKAETLGAPRQQVLRDVEGYVVASCLAYQSQPYLKDQGDASSSVIVQRMKGGPDVLAPLTRR